MRKEQLALSWPSRPSYLTGDYVVGRCNRAAHDLVTRWPDWPHFAVSLHGPAGSGKTHLAQIWLEKAGGAVCDSTELLMRGPQVLAAHRRSWVIELDALAGQDRTAVDTALFHLHNLIRQQDGWLLFVSREPVARGLVVALPDLRSRLAACPAIGIEAPDDQLLAAVMHKLAADRQITLGNDVVATVLTRVERSFAGVAAAVAALDAAALARRRAITRGLARAVLPAQAGHAATEESE